MTLDDRDGNAVTLHQAGGVARLRSASGLAGLSTPRANVTVAPTRHGSVDNTRFTEGAVVVLEGFVFSESSAAVAMDGFRDLTVPMLQTLDDGPALLKWTEFTSGLALQKTVRLASDVTPVIVPGPNMIEYQAQFLAADPRSYSQSLTTATGDELFTTGGFDAPFTAPIIVQDDSSGTVAVDNTGNRPTPAVFRVYGYATDPQIVLVGDSASRRIAMTGTIGPGDYLELDVQARTVKLNGTSPAQEFIDAANTTWFELPTGTSTIQLTVGSSDTVTRLDVLYRPAYT